MTIRSIFKQLLLSFLLLTFILLTAFVGIKAIVLKPAKDDTIGVKDWLSVPVFYASKRKYTGSNGSIEYSEEASKTGTKFGVKNIAIPLPKEGDWAKEKAEGLGWQEIHNPESEAGKLPLIDQSSCKIKGRLLEKDEIASEFHSYSASSGTKECLVFVHGCCANFDTSMKRAAKIAAHMGIPVLLYDWVSPAGFKHYLENETRVSQTEDDFCKFIEALDTIADPGEISILGHSMGALFVDEAMMRRSIIGSFKSLKPYREIIMSNADLDARTFLNHASEFSSNTKALRIYFSSNDDRLEASSLAHGGFARLGMPGELLSDLCRQKQLKCFDITALGSGHEIPFSVVAAMHGGQNERLEKEFILEESDPGYVLIKYKNSTEKALTRAVPNANSYTQRSQISLANEKSEAKAQLNCLCR